MSFSCLCNLHCSLPQYCPPLPAQEIKNLQSNLQEVRDQRTQGDAVERGSGIKGPLVSSSCQLLTSFLLSSCMPTCPLLQHTYSHCQALSSPLF